MAAYLIIVAFAHSTGIPEVISGPEVPAAEQRQRFKEAMGERVHEKYAKIDLLDSRRGIRKSKNFMTPVENKRRIKEIARQEKEVERLQNPKKAKPEKADTPPGEETPPDENPPGDETPPGDPPPE